MHEVSSGNAQVEIEIDSPSLLYSFTIYTMCFCFLLWLSWESVLGDPDFMLPIKTYKMH